MGAIEHAIGRADDTAGPCQSLIIYQDIISGRRAYLGEGAGVTEAKTEFLGAGEEGLEKKDVSDFISWIV